MIYKVVFHIDESSKWELLLKNVSNLAQHIDFSASKVEVLANAEAVREYSGKSADPLHAHMDKLAASGVRFAACSHALTGLGISSEELPPFVCVVPAGVLELIERQAEGYAYIKP